MANVPLNDSSPTPTPVENDQTSVEDEATLQPNPRWRTVVHNDPINLMSYVQWVFESYFGMSAAKARERMMRVHHRGRAVVSTGQRESMERDAQAMHTYGLKATIEPDGDDQ